MFYMSIGLIAKVEKNIRNPGVHSGELDTTRTTCIISPESIGM